MVRKKIPITPISQQEITQAAVLNIVGQNLGRGLTYDSDKTMVNATRSGLQRYDSAETHAEANLNHTHTDTTVKNNGVEMNGEETGNYSVSSTQDDVGQTWLDGSEFDSDFELNKSVLEIEITFAEYLPSGSFPFEIYRKGTTNSTVYTHPTEVSAGDTVTIDGSDANLATNDTHAVRLINNTGSHITDTGYVDTGSDVHTNSVFDWYGKDNNSTFEKIVQDVTMVHSRGLSGSARLDWTDDRYISEWNVASYVVDESNGGNIDIYVVYDDGTGWSRANNGNPINRNYSLSDDSAISPSDNVGLEAEFSRSSVSENPRLENAYVSWQL